MQQKYGTVKTFFKNHPHNFENANNGPWLYFCFMIQVLFKYDRD